MTGGLASLGLRLAWLVAGAALLYAVLKALLWGVELLPLSQARRSLLARASPVVATLFALAVAVVAVRTLLEEDAPALPYVVAVVLAVLVVASWSAIRDFVSGVIIKAERACVVGDRVRIGDIEGRVDRLGLRVLALETQDGDVAVVPYGTVTRAAIVRLHAVQSGAAHVFRLRPRGQLSLAEVKPLVLRAALGCHWASIAREPEVVPVEGGDLEVTVFAVDPGRAPDVEAAVRRAVEAGSEDGWTKPPAR